MTVRGSQPLPTEIDPDDRFPTFVTLDQDMDADLSDGELQHNRDLEDVQNMFTDNVLIDGRQRLRQPAAHSTPPPPRPPSPVPGPRPAPGSAIPAEVLELLRTMDTRMAKMEEAWENQKVCNAILEVNQ